MVAPNLRLTNRMPLLLLVAATAFGATFARQSPPPSPQQTPDQKQITIDISSVTSLQLKIFHNEVEIGGATGFVMEKNNKRYLVTNRHVILACAQDKNPTNVGGWICANKLGIFHNKLNHLGEWVWVTEDLVDEHKQQALVRTSDIRCRGGSRGATSEKHGGRESSIPWMWGSARLTSSSDRRPP